MFKTKEIIGDGKLYGENGITSTIEKAGGKVIYNVVNSPMNNVLFVFTINNKYFFMILKLSSKKEINEVVYCLDIHKDIVSFSPLNEKEMLIYLHTDDYMVIKTNNLENAFNTYKNNSKTLASIFEGIRMKQKSF